jgi:DNA-binding transcriptional MerR regulator
MNKEEEIADKVIYTEYFTNWLRAYIKTKEAKGISLFFNEKNKKLDRTKISYRKINHWQDEGLIDFEKEGNEWLKFSLMDALWLYIIDELRDWGISLEKIKKTKSSLSRFQKETGRPMPVLEYCAFIGIIEKIPLTLIVFSDGSCAPITYEEYKLNMINGIPDHMCIRLNNILQKFFPGENLSPEFLVDFHLEQNELVLLDYLRSSNCEHITIHYKGGKMERLESLERVDNKKRISEILKENKYQNIEMIQKDGKIVSIVRKVSKKFSQ